MDQRDIEAFTDDQLLQALNDSRVYRVQLEKEIEERFEDRTSATIGTLRFLAKRRTDTTKYVFSEANMLLLAASLSDETRWQELKDAAREIGRPFVSLSKKEEQS